MMTKVAAAYQMGVQKALEAWGLEKTALVPELLGRATRFAGANPLAARALIGAGLGAGVGGMTDVGAGRGALAGGLAGLGSGFGAKWGRGAYGKGMMNEIKGVQQAARGASSGATSSQAAIEAIGQKYGFGAPAWKQNLQRAGMLGGVGAGALAGGGALMATQPSQPKPWYAGLMGG